MHIEQATAEYEDWLGKRITLIPTDLKIKHENMVKDRFIFLRATCYRWASRWHQVCPHLANAPVLLGVGDAHLENFGTWRDAEARLVYGVNDFDEVDWMPYTNDLLRLATSTNLAIQSKHLNVNLKEACRAILSGYTSCLEFGGKPLVLAEDNLELRAMARGRLREPAQFWQRLETQLKTSANPPADARQALESMLPVPNLPYRTYSRRAGQGSLGKRRFVAVATSDGAKIAREAKEMSPSSYAWASGGKEQILAQELLNKAVRCRDPKVLMHGNWLVRRLAPDCSKIDVSLIPKERDELRLLEAMGWETGNIHLGTPEVMTLVLRDLRKRGTAWLREAVEAMTEDVLRDWKDWKKVMRGRR